MEFELESDKFTVSSLVRVLDVFLAHILNQSNLHIYQFATFRKLYVIVGLIWVVIALNLEELILRLLLLWLS